MQPVGEPLISKLPSNSSLLRRTFDFNIGRFNLKPEYWQAFTILFLIFLIIITIARWRHLYVKWNLSSFLPSIMLGFVLALILEGFLLIGGRTLFTEILGWENAPKPISTIIDSGREKLVNVLGASEDVQIPAAVADEASSVQRILFEFELLDETSASEVKKQICEP